MVVGLDLATSITGCAAITAARRPVVSALEALRLPGAERVTESATRVVGWVVAQRPDLVVVERPPMVIRGDVQHGSQAEIGYKLGRITGLVEAGLRSHGLPYELVDVSTWRDTMLSTSTGWGVPAAKPGAPPVAAPLFQRARCVREGGDVFLVWPCGHRRLFDPARAASTDTSCRQCASGERPPKRRSEWVTAEWKRIACELTRAHWPEAYAAVVADARSRARKAKPDHLLEGVSDAAEACWLAVHGARARRAVAA